ncbi:MAG: VanZ family protein [Rhodobacteraceae bacterium]|nr:VanZ family protein [Paracoccaceae bacterium]TVR49614.1 MAG: VanZ family protein [Paracoccaceae bacterium]
MGSAVLAIIVLVLLLMPSPEAPSSAPSFIDKVAHFLLFFALVLPILSVRPRWWIWVVPLAIGYGALLEVIQPYFGRGFDWFDMLANAVGAIAAVPVAHQINSRWLQRR